MGEWEQIGKLLLAAGLALTLLGGVLFVGAKLLGENRLSWLGRLPGDIRIERKGWSCVFPLASSILVSLLLTVLLNLIVRWLKR
jgi:hypothetical protein